LAKALKLSTLFQNGILDLQANTRPRVAAGSECFEELWDGRAVSRDFSLMSSSIGRMPTAERRLPVPRARLYDDNHDRRSHRQMAVGCSILQDTFSGYSRL